jgi:uncharacterized protein YabE (DUF348 family)
MQLYNKLKDKKMMLAIVVLVVVALAVPSTWFLLNSKTITVVDEGVVAEYKTLKSNLQAFLQSNSIDIGTNDAIDRELDDKIKDKDVINIKRGKLVTVSVDNETLSFYSVSDTIGQALEEANVVLGEHDVVSMDLQAPLTRKNEIVINRISYEVQTEREPINFQKIVNRNPDIELGIKKEIQIGRPGEKEFSIQVTYQDGEEIARKVIGEKVIAEARDHIIEEGTKNYFITARGERRTFKKVIYMTSTWYNADFESTGKNPGDKGYGITATGTTVRHGTVAVDPRVIRLGTNLYVESLTSHPDYGLARAEDTGGAIKGDKIDLYFPTKEEASKYGFGKRMVKVYILD